MTYEKRIAQLEEKIRTQQDLLRSREKAYMAARSQLDGVVRSAAWRMILFVREHGIERAFPRGSRRRSWYSSLMKRFSDPQDCARMDYRHDQKKRHRRLNAFLSRRDSVVRFPVFEQPRVSLILLTCNKAEYTFPCLESIVKHTAMPYEIIIVDNGSVDSTHRLFAKLAGARIFPQEANLRFAAGCNVGVREARGEYLLFLNNDTEVTAGWLDALVCIADRDPRCGAVGAKLVYPDGTLQEAGSILWNDGSAYAYGRGDYPARFEYSYTRHVDYCSAACLLVRRSAFDTYGGFDEQFYPAYYEDTDLMLGIRSLGYSVQYQPDSIVYHHEFTTNTPEGALLMMRESQKKFYAKWREALMQDYSPPAIERLLAVRDRRAGETILFLDDDIPAPSAGCGLNRAFQFLSFLSSLGHKVTFVPCAPYRTGTNGRECEQQGVEVAQGITDPNDFFASRADFYDIVIVSRPHTMKRYHDALRIWFPDAMIVYDAEALYFYRDDLLEGISDHPALAAGYERWSREEEFAQIKKADAIISVSSRECAMIRQECGTERPCHAWGHAMPLRQTHVPFSARSDILFVGTFSFLGCSNEDAILFFINTVFPRISNRLNCRLIVVGRNPPDTIRKHQSACVVFPGFVDDLAAYYNSSRIFIAPHRYATGVPWKVQEAMSYGLPCVLTPLIAQQICAQDGIQAVVAQLDNFAEAIARLYDDERLWSHIQSNAYSFMSDTCDPTELRDHLSVIVGSFRLCS